MSGYRMWRLAVLIPLILLKYAFYSSHDSYDYTPPAFNYTPPSFDYTPPVLPSVPDPKVEPEHVVADTLQVEDGDAPDVASAKGDLEPVIALPGAFSSGSEPAFPHVMVGDNAAIGITMADPSVVVGKRWLQAWNLTPAQALAIATANLRQDHVAFVQVEPGLWSTPDSDTIGASRILLVDEIKKLHLAGGPVAMIPNRGTLLLAGASDPKGLAAMATHAGDLEGTAHPIHTIPLCLAGAAWKECVPHPNADVGLKLSDLASNGRAAVYNAVSDTYQKEIGDDIFVAHVKVFTPDDDKPSSTIVNWLKGYESMLPKAELVAFVVSDDNDPDHPTILGYAPWERVVAAFGTHMKANGRIPTYYANGGWFPSDAQLKQLGLTPIKKRQ